MDERKEDVLEMTNEEYQVSSPDYGELIIEMVHKIKNKKFLQRIYVSMREYIKEKSE